MSKKLSDRLTSLEQAAHPGGYEVLYKNDWRAGETEDYPARLAAAQQRAGPNGTLIVVEYVDDWRGSEGSDR